MTTVSAPSALAGEVSSRRILLVYSRPGAIDDDSIAAYTDRLQHALEDTHRVTVEAVPLETAARIVRSEARPSLVLVQYNPYSYGRWGIAPHATLALRGIGRRTRLAVMVHEGFVPPGSLLHKAQRAQLRAVCGAASVLLAPSVARCEQVAATDPRHRVAHRIPVGSNLPDSRNSREATRAALSVKQHDIVVAQFGTSHPGRLHGHVAAALASIAASVGEITLLDLGRDTQPLQAPDGVRIVTPGPQPADALARLLAGADLFLSPYVDGVTGRRTAVMAALQHGIPVVGTLHAQTDPEFRTESAAVFLSPVEDVDAFASAARGLAVDEEVRARSALAARRLYERAFDWPHIARSVLEAVDG